jgi:hypothetical protein
MEVGTSAISNSCSRKCTCEGDGLEAVCIDYSCESNQVCYMSGGEQYCTCEEPNYENQDGECLGEYSVNISWLPTCVCIV